MVSTFNTSNHAIFLSDDWSLFGLWEYVGDIKILINAWVEKWMIKFCVPRFGSWERNITEEILFR